MQKFLIMYRKTSSKSSPNGKSPAELMLGRTIRINLASLKEVKPPDPGQRDLKIK